MVNLGTYFDAITSTYLPGSFFKVTGNDSVGTVSYGVPLTLNGGTADALTQTAYLGAITLNGGELTSDLVSPAVSGSWVFLGNVTATADSTISAENVNVGLTSASRDFNVDAGKVLTFSGSYADAVPVTGVSSLSKSGSGTLVMSGSTKTYTGTTTVTGGLLKFADQAQLGLSAATVHANLVFNGGAIEYTGTGAFGRKFLVKDGGAGFHATSGNPLLVNGADQIDFDDTAPATATSRPLTLSGTSILANTYDAGLLDNTEAARAFSSIVKNGVGQFIKPSVRSSAAFLSKQIVSKKGLVSFQYTAPVNGGYNMSLIAYALAPAGRNGASDKLIAGYLKDYVNSCAPAEAAKLGYVAITGDLKKTALSLIDLIAE